MENGGEGKPGGRSVENENDSEDGDRVLDWVSTKPGTKKQHEEKWRRRTDYNFLGSKWANWPLKDAVICK